jgi:hypothetical protein
LAVSYNGILIENPADLTARDNWFKRYERVLEGHLRDGRTAHVYTLAPGRLSDPLVTHKASSQGPFPFPKGAVWPTCTVCNSRLGFLGVLDFRGYSALPLRPGSLVVHACLECGIPSDRGTWSVQWIREGDEIEILGNRDKQVLVGTRWHAMDYPLPRLGPKPVAPYPEDIVTSGPFLQETGIYANFACYAHKVGGRVFWLQHEDRLIDENSFVSDEGEPMTYIGQLIRSRELNALTGLGIAYILYSPTSGETIMYPQSD